MTGKEDGDEHAGEWTHRSIGVSHGYCDWNVCGIITMTQRWVLDCQVNHSGHRTGCLWYCGIYILTNCLSRMTRGGAGSDGAPCPPPPIQAPSPLFFCCLGSRPTPSPPHHSSDRRGEAGPGPMWGITGPEGGKKLGHGSGGRSSRPRLTQQRWGDGRSRFRVDTGEEWA